MDRTSSAVVVAVVVLALAPSLAAGAMQDHKVKGQPSLSVSLPDDEFAPGERTTLDVVLYNDGNLTQGSPSNPELERRVTLARAVRANVSDEKAPVSISTNERFVDALPEGSSVPLSFGVAVASDADPGTYTVPLTVRYNYTDRINTRTGNENTTTGERTFDLRITVEDVAQFQVVDVSSNTRVGATGTVGVTLKNTGSERARNATVALTSQNADLTFGAAGSASRYAGADWGPGETRTVEYRVTTAPSAAQQRYTFSAQISFEDGQGIPTRSESLSFGVVPQREQEFSIVDVDTDLAVDDEATVAVTLTNDGPLTVREAGVTITSASGDVVFGESASASQYVGRWRPGTERTVRVEATATPDAQARNYSFDARVSYEDREGDPGSAGPLQFGLAPGPERNPEFEIDDVSSSLRVGGEGALSGTITNVGEERADNLVIVLEPTNQNVEPLEREYSIGRLRPGRSAEFAFDLEISDAAEAGPKRFTVHAEYRDEDNDPRTSDSFDLRERVRPSRNAFAIGVRDVNVPQGGSQTVRVTVRNNRDETLRSISAQVFADDPIGVGDSEAFIPRLDPGATTTIQFQISVGSGALPRKTYPVEMDFQYDDAEGDTQLSDTYAIPVQVSRAESSDSPPVWLLIGGAIVIVAVAVLGYRRYNG